MGDYKPVKGDRVRIVVEDVVLDAGTSDIQTNNNWFDREGGHVVSVEKIEPPVTAFKPGDVVRNRFTRWLYSIAESGYLSHHDRTFYPWGPTRQDHFNSKRYELVDLSK